MPPPCIGFEIGLGHICWYFRAYICSKILKVLHPCIGFGIGLGHIWGHANAWIWYIHAYAWILYIHVLSHISHIPKAEIFGFMFQYLSSERMGLRFWANPIHNTWLDHGEISRTRCTPFCPVMPPAVRPLYFRPDIRNWGRGGPSYLPRGVSIAWILSNVFWSLHSEKFLHLAQHDWSLSKIHR